MNLFISTLEPTILLLPLMTTLDLFSNDVTEDRGRLTSRLSKRLPFSEDMPKLMGSVEARGSEPKDDVIRVFPGLLPMFVLLWISVMVVRELESGPLL